MARTPEIVVESLVELAQPTDVKFSPDMYKGNKALYGPTAPSALSAMVPQGLFEEAVEPVYPGVSWEVARIQCEIDKRAGEVVEPLDEDSVLERVLTSFWVHMTDQFDILFLDKTEEARNHGRLVVITALDLLEQDHRQAC